VKILICGDSFACDWSIKYTDYPGWPNLLAEKYQVTNVAQAGCSQYKILNQLMTQTLDYYDRIIISHTSPYRIPVDVHPVHKSDKLHKNSDLLYTDIKYHSVNNHNLLSIVDFFENYFNEQAFLCFHSLLCEKIDRLTKKHRVLHITHIPWDSLYVFQNWQNFETLWKSNPGLVNHYNMEANKIIMHTIDNWCLQNQ